MKNMKKSTLLITFTSLLFIFILYSNAALASQSQGQETPSQLAHRLFKTVKQIKKADPDKNILLSPTEDKMNRELAVVLNLMLDIPYISRYALMKHWDTLSDQDRQLFVSVFTDLLSKVAYPNAGKFLKDLEFSIRREKKIGKKVMVYTTVIHKEEGRIDIDFKLMQVKDKDVWMVIDVYLDGVSLARNLRTQCLKIIRDHSFEELITRMTKKIEERETAHLKEVTGRN
jgi:phospholipid transport system substrate-binding protein